MISEIENVTGSRRIYDPFSRILLEHLAVSPDEGGHWVSQDIEGLATAGPL